MRIDDLSGAAAATGASQAGRTQPAEQTDATHARHAGSIRHSASDDSVELSGTSLAVSQFSSARSAKLSQLRQSIQQGSYLVDAAATGKALVGETLAAGQGR